MTLMPAAGGGCESGLGIAVLGTAMAFDHARLRAAALRVGAACARRQPAASRLAFRALLALAARRALVRLAGKPDAARSRIPGRPQRRR
jgi:hypothetical protein